MNPAMLANSRYARATGNYRSQRTGGDFNINSNFLEVTQPLLNPSTGQPWSAVSISFHHDRSAGIFVTNEAAVAYAVAVRLSRTQHVGFGARVLHQSRSVDFSGFFTGSQYVPDRGFNQTLSNGEQLTHLRTALTTFSTGLYWQQADSRELPQHYFGLTVFDLNRPPDAFLAADSRLPSTLTLTGGWQWWKKKDLRLYTDLLAVFSAGNPWLNVGVRLQKQLQPRQPKNTDRVELLLRYVPLRSGIVGVQLHQKNLSLGLSYDFPVFYQNVGNLSALEIALQLRKLTLPKSRRITAKKKSTTTRAAVPPAKPAPSAPRPPAASVPTDTLVARTANTTDSVTENPKAKGTATAGEIEAHMDVVKTQQLHFHFEFNSATLDEDAIARLQEFRDALRADTGLYLRVEGFTDNVGHAHFNRRLSLKRANAVCDFLKKSGISPTRLEAIGRGEDEPLNENLTEADRAENRRVILTLYRPR